MSYIIPLKECRGREAEVGGKASGLARLIDSGLPVPGGFCVTTNAYQEVLAAGGLDTRINELLTAADHRQDNTEISEQVEQLFESLELPAQLAADITGAYEAIGNDEFVAIRSSATAEDQANASFAGQQETYLYVRGADAVVTHIIRCWASLFSPQAIGYRAKLGIETPDLAMAVVVQRMIPATAAGVMMTLHPVTGDRSRIFIEASHGLGEGVVRGEVGIDNFEVDKQTLKVLNRTVNQKRQAYHYSEQDNAVTLVDVETDRIDTSCLEDGQIEAVARLGRQVEEAFGKPMDIEWATVDGEVLLLQARPETVWGATPEPSPDEAVVEPGDPRDPLHTFSVEDIYWTTSNIGEAMPGVMSPLGWTLWGCSERALRNAIADMGVLTETERAVPARKDEWFMRAFFGRIAWQVNLFATIGDRMPGTSAEESAKSLLGRVPEDLPSQPTKRYYARIARGMAKVVLTSPKEVRDAASQTRAWYRRTVPRVPTMSLQETQETMRETERVFEYVLAAQARVTFAVIQPLYDALERIVKKAGAGDAGALSGSGGAEVSGMLTDMWEAAKGQLEMDELLLRVGYHGPGEGEASNRSWREDPTPLLRMLEEYRGLSESESPTAKEDHAKRTWKASAAELLATLPAWKRPFVKRFLRLAAKQIPLRGVAKRGMLQSIDACRAAARRAGELLVADGVLDTVEDVFYLTLPELTSEIPADAKDLVRHRHQRRRYYERLVIPGAWRGMPVPTEPETAAAEFADDSVVTVTGVGVSRGTVEGPAKVVNSADFAEVAPGEILVAPTTDPSWASIMFVSAGLVVDIGGTLSHAAVVARELTLPAVVNTRTGTKVIRTGDLLRVDGGAGTVHIVERAESTTRDQSPSCASAVGDA